MRCCCAPTPAAGMHGGASEIMNYE
jgi:hypothetical protein